jgi:hypothetical protein
LGEVHVQPDVDLQRYLDEQEFRLGMRVNLGAIILSTLLAFGIWLAGEMVETQKVQGCYALLIDVASSVAGAIKS